MDEEKLRKIKVKPQIVIKNIEKSVIGIQKIKNNIVKTKEKINEFTINEQNNTAEDFASNKIQNDISYISRKGLEKGNEVEKNL